MRKKILIFGGNGVIGSYLVNQLQFNYDVYSVDISFENNKKLKKKNKIKFSKNLNFNSLFNKNNFYSVIHCMQFKSKNFVLNSLDNFDKKLYENVMYTNLELPLHSISEYIKSIKKLGSIGRVINFTSTYGIISSSPTLYHKTEMGNPPYYSISKFGLMGLTKYVASYFKEYKILCNSISPHGIENNQSKKFKQNFSKRSPLGRLSHPKEILPAVEFLLNPDNNYTNGANIAVDGGWTAC